MRLSKENNYMVLENQGLIHTIISRNFGINRRSSEYEDLVSVGTIGLIQAINTFDASKGKKFALYASVLIRNEICKYIKKNSIYKREIPIDAPNQDNDECTRLKVINDIEDPKSDFIKQIIVKEEFKKLISIILNHLKEKERLIMLYTIAGKSQEYISKVIKSNQSNVSRMVSRITNDIQKVFSRKLSDREVFSMDIIGNIYQISFLSQDFSNFNMDFAISLQESCSVGGCSSFNVRENKGRVTLEMPAELESFLFIAKIIQEADNFDNPVNCEKDEIDVQKTKITRVTKCSISENNESKGSKMNDIIAHILRLDRLDVKEFKQQFGDTSSVTINNAIATARKKGIIIHLTRGQYLVNKN